MLNLIQYLIEFIDKALPIYKFMYTASMIRFIALLIPFVPTWALAQATSLDDVPIAWGEQDNRHTTVCAKRWHAITIRDIRTRSVDQGESAATQIQKESKAVISGKADCFTAQIIYWPVVHADVILDARTWVQVLDKTGPVSCFDNKRCRWTVQIQNFVEAKIILNGQEVPESVYVATPRAVQPARIAAPELTDKDTPSEKIKPAPN